MGEFGIDGPPRTEKASWTVLFLTVWFKYFEDALESQHGPRSVHDRRSSDAREPQNALYPKS
jgi:hypothetical protein